MAAGVGYQRAVTLREPLPKARPQDAQTWREHASGGVVETISDNERYGSDFKFSDAALAVMERRNPVTLAVTSDWEMAVDGATYRVVGVDDSDRFTLRVTLDREAA